MTLSQRMYKAADSPLLRYPTECPFCHVAPHESCRGGTGLVRPTHANRKKLGGGYIPEPASTDPGETWRVIPGFPTYYVSSTGNVFSVKSNRNLKSRQNRGRYLAVFVCNSGTKHRSIHSLVAEAFLGPRPEGFVVRHLNGDHLDNRLENLAYGTTSENVRDTIRHGNHHELNKTHCPSGHEYDEENTYWTGPKKTHRKCRACNSSRMSAINREVRLQRRLRSLESLPLSKKLLFAAAVLESLAEMQRRQPVEKAPYSARELRAEAENMEDE